MGEDPTTEKPKRAGRPKGRAARPENKRVPEPAPKLTDKEKEKLDRIADDALFLSQDEIACVHLAMKKNREAAANRLGWTIEQVLHCLKQPHVKLYAIEYREKFIKTMAQKEASELRKVGISRETIMERLMSIAQLDPADTKGSVDGQVKALQALGAMVGLGKGDPLGDKSDEELLSIVNSARDKSAGKKPAVQ